MFAAITRLLTPAAPARSTSRPTVLTLTAMEDRYAPAAMAGSIRMFDPQPEPPTGSQVCVPSPGFRSIIISGG